MQIGDVNPDFNMGLNSTLQWHALSLSGTLNWVKGGKIYNYTRQWPFNELRDKVFDQSSKPATTCPANWQGSSGHTSMMTLAPLNINNTTTHPARAMVFGESGANNGQIFEGSLYTPPGGTLYFDKNNDLVAGPMSIGSFDSGFNNATLCPLPVIDNMPTALISKVMELVVAPGSETERVVLEDSAPT